MKLHSRLLHLSLLTAIGWAAASCTSATATRNDLAKSRRDATGRDAGAATQSPASASSIASTSSRKSQGESLPLVEGPVSLLDAVNIALAQNLTLRVAYFRHEEAAGVYEEARGAILPQAALTASATDNLNHRDVDKDVYTYQFRITQPLWRGGALLAGLRYAELYKASADIAIQKQVQDTIATTTRLYLSVLLEEQMTKVYEESLATAERLLKTAKSKLDAGVVSAYEVLRAEVEVSTAQADLLRAQNNKRTALVTLLRALGVSQDSAIKLSGTLQYRPEVADEQTLIRTALEKRPDLLLAEAEVRMARENVGITRAQFGPSVDAFLNDAGRRPESYANDRRGWYHTWTAGVSLSYVLTDSVFRRGRLWQATSRLDQTEAALRNAEEEARVDVLKALLDLRYAEELYQSQKKNIDVATEALRMIEVGAHTGKNTQLEVLDAQSALTSAVGRYYNAVHGHCVARINLQYTTGSLGPDALDAINVNIQLPTDPLFP